MTLSFGSRVSAARYSTASVSVDHNELMETQETYRRAVLGLVIGSWVVQLVQITGSE